MAGAVDSVTTSTAAKPKPKPESEKKTKITGDEGPFTKPEQIGANAGQTVSQLMANGKSKEVFDATFTFAAKDTEKGVLSLDSGLAFAHEALDYRRSADGKVHVENMTDIEREAAALDGDATTLSDAEYLSVKLLQDNTATDKEQIAQGNIFDAGKVDGKVSKEEKMALNNLFYNVKGGKDKVIEQLQNVWNSTNMQDRANNFKMPPLLTNDYKVDPNAPVPAEIDGTQGAYATSAQIGANAGWQESQLALSSNPDDMLAALTADIKYTDVDASGNIDVAKALAYSSASLDVLRMNPATGE
jgi:hypothetical protein